MGLQATTSRPVCVESLNSQARLHTVNKLRHTRVQGRCASKAPSRVQWRRASGSERGEIRLQCPNAGILYSREVPPMMLSRTLAALPRRRGARAGRTA